MTDQDATELATTNDRRARYRNPDGERWSDGDKLVVIPAAGEHLTVTRDALTLLLGLAGFVPVEVEDEQAPEQPEAEPEPAKKGGRK